MRNHLLLLVTVVSSTAVLAPAVARADNADAVAGRFDVKYEEVTSNCQDTGMVLARGELEIAKRKGSQVTVDIARMPIMTGTANKGGRVKAASKLGKTSIQGLDGRFSVAGTVNADGILNIVFVAEYYLSGKAHCTQSWNVSGLRKEAATAKPDAKSSLGSPAGLRPDRSAPSELDDTFAAPARTSAMDLHRPFE
jgi:hypothetical protein